jgi:hypothetical protein
MRIPGTCTRLASATILAGLLVVVMPLASGCTRSIEMTYTPSLYRLPQADAWKGIKLGIARLEDRRSWIDRSDVQSLSYFMHESPWRFGLTHKNKDYTPVATIIQDLFVDEFTRAGVDASAIDRVLTKDAVPAMREAGEQARVAHVLGGRIHVFEVVNETHLFTVTSRRAITLEIHLTHVAGGTLALDSTVTFNDRRGEGMGVLHSTNVDRLMNTVFRQVVTQVVEQVAAKLALDPRDVHVRVTGARW